MEVPVVPLFNPIYSFLYLHVYFQIIPEKEQKEQQTFILTMRKPRSCFNYSL